MQISLRDIKNQRYNGALDVNAFTQFHLGISQEVAGIMDPGMHRCFKAG